LFAQTAGFLVLAVLQMPFWLWLETQIEALCAGSVSEKVPSENATFSCWNKN